MTAIPKAKTTGWGVIAMLAAAQFIMVLDTTVMNVSITQVAADLNTTVVGLQTAITLYTLVMGAFMLLGDRWGAKRAFIIGLLAYGLGSLTTALSRSLEVAAVTEQYANAQIMALKVAFASLAFFALLALWYVQTLPKRAAFAKSAGEPPSADEAAPALSG